MCWPICANYWPSAGYNVLTNNNLRDSLILLRATRPGLTILGYRPES